jgi:hypothetical protein
MRFLSLLIGVLLMSTAAQAQTGRSEPRPAWA